MGVECDHDHDGYATGYQHALDYVFEYVEHLAMTATSQRLTAQAEELKLSKQWYGGREAAFREVIEWISEEDEDDDGDRLTVTTGV